MSMNFAQQEQLRMLERLTESVIARRDTLSNIANTFGPRYAEIIQERLSASGHTGNGTAEKRSVIMRQQRERNELAAKQAQERTSVGMLAYNPKQEIFTAVLRKHLDGCESGEYPTATKTAQAIVGDKATKLLAKTAKTRLRTAFNDNKEHPGMQRISALVSHSSITAASSGTVSSCLGALADTHKIARLINQERAERMQEQEQQRQRDAAMQAELVTVRAEAAEAKAEAARANSRLDETDRWKADAVKLYLAGKSYGSIAVSVVKGKSTVNDYIRTLISAGTLEARS